MSDFLVALGLLTIAPTRSVDGSRISARAFAYYPLVGAIIGGTLALAFLCLRLAFSDLVAAALLVTLWAIITGALHLDGFADACDALFAATTLARRLEILRDVHLGAFGVVGLALLLITKVAAIASVSTSMPIVLAPLLGRWAMVYAAAYPPARAEGMAVMFRDGLTRGILFVATLLAALFAAFGGRFGLGALVIAILIATLIARLALSRLGGLTGDVYGMICESVEVGVLLIGGLKI